MNTEELIRLGVPVGESIAIAHLSENFIALGDDGALLEGAEPGGPQSANDSLSVAGCISRDAEYGSRDDRSFSRVA